jgi:hypothetical protein
MASLANFPVELSQQIFEYACIDDGTTGRSLSLVSKSIHLTSRPYKFQSITICGADHATRFLLTLKQTPPQYRRVAYLRIANDSTMSPVGYPTPPKPLPPGIVHAASKAVEAIPGVKWYKKYKQLKENVHYNVRCMQTNRRRDESIFVALLQMLHLIAPTLRALHVDFESRWKIIPACLEIDFEPIRAFPVLSSLTLRYFALFHAEVDESMFLGAGKVLGGLKYLDLVGFRVQLEPGEMYGWVRRVAPGLRYLRLPMRMAGGLQSALSITLTGAEAETQSNPVPDLRLPPTLQKIYIQLHHHPSAHCAICPVEEFRELESRDERVVVLDPGFCDEGIEDVVRMRVGGGR